MGGNKKSLSICLGSIDSCSELTNPGDTLDKMTLSILLSSHSWNKGEGESIHQLWVLVEQWGMQKHLKKFMLVGIKIGEKRV